MTDNLHTSTILPSGKEPPVSIKYSVVWAWSYSARFREEKNLVFLPAIEQRFLCYPARNLVTVPNTRSLLRLKCVS
jgi:hypothetical protein